MALTSKLATELRRLSPREKATLADHLWRAAELKIGSVRKVQQKDGSWLVVGC
jgi:hypothetical protein